MCENRKSWRIVAGLIVACLAYGSALGGPKQGDSPKGKIEAGKPQYLKKDHEAWKERGRIVGIAENAPAFTVAVKQAGSKDAKKVEVEGGKEGRKVFEVWLEPDEYHLRVRARGYEPLTLKGLQVRAGYDLRVDLEFTSAER